MSTVTVATCHTCRSTELGERMSRHQVSTGWLTYYRCAGCHGVAAVHTPRITWNG